MNTTTTLIQNRFRVALDEPSTFIGQGGMGTVYRGLDTSSQVPVAVKILKGDLVSRDPELVRRFQREGQTLRQLNHPNIVKLLGTEEQAGIHYLVMEYVSGGSLRDALDEDGQFSIQRALYIALDLADALTRAHRLRILHRDIKPGNVLLAEDGTPLLTDFGMARVSGEPNITQDGAIVGTMAYLAPEAFQGEEVDERSDIWAFGVMLWEMLAGERPYPQEQPAPLIQAIMTEQLPELEKLRPDLPTALVDLIYRMLMKNRSARIPSVRLIGAELEAIIRGGTSSMQPVVSVSDSTGRFDLETTEFPAPNGTRFVAPNNLRQQPTAFVGRDDELEKLQRLIMDNASLITLTGPGGIGKSRLAIALAEHNISHFEDGVYNIMLECLDSANNVVNTIADNIDYAFGGGEPKTELLNYLREKRMLLVLDNFENVMDAAGLISDIMANAPKVTLVVTSRERLRLRGEQVFDVDSMKTPSKADETAQKLGKLPVAQLFLQSAQRVMPHFELRDDNAPDVAEVIRLVGGLPLGVELAAGWLEMLPLDEIVSEISHSLGFLETDLRDVPERHRSLTAVADYSWNLLNDDEREIFLKLSVFRSGFEREAAQEVTGASLRNLTNLVNKSLLVREPQGRYHMNKLLRQYAEQRFKDHDAKMPTHMAFAAYYIKLAVKLSEVLNTAKEQATYEAIDKELDNIRAVWQMGKQYAKYEKIDALQDTFFQYFLGRSMFIEGEELFKTFADKMQSEGQTGDIYQRARLRQAIFVVRQGQLDAGLVLAENGLRYFEDKDTRESVMARMFIGNILMFQGDYQRSVSILEEAYDKLPDGQIWLYAAIVSSLGYVHFLKGDLLEARQVYAHLEAKAMDEDFAPSLQANIKNNFGEVLQRLGEYRNALTLFEESLEFSKLTDNPRGIAVALLNVAGIHFQQGDYDRARNDYNEAYQLNRDMGDRWGIAQALSNLGNLALAENDHQAAYNQYNAALTIRRELGEKRGVADSLMDIAFCAMSQGAIAEATKQIDEALDIRREIGDKIGEGTALTNRGIAYLLANDIDAARKDLSAGQVIGEETGSIFIRAQAYAGLGELAFIEGDHDKALLYFKMVLKENNKEDAPLGMILWALLGVAQIKLEAGDAVSSLQMVTLILRYPHNYISIIEKRAKSLMNRLTESLDENAIESTMTATKSLVLRNYIDELLAE